MQNYYDVQIGNFNHLNIAWDVQKLFFRQQGDGSTILDLVSENEAGKWKNYLGENLSGNDYNPVKFSTIMEKRKDKIEIKIFKKFQENFGKYSFQESDL